jgi:hypothetical protein
MNVLEREIRIKLDILESVAKSQRALARILESAADVYDHLPALAGRIGENIEQLADCQRALADLLVPLRIPRKKKGLPGKPWLASSVRCAGRNATVPPAACAQPDTMPADDRPIAAR